MVEPRRVLRYIYIGRLSLAAAIFLAAVFSWHGADARDTLLATLAFFAAIAFTSVSAWFALAYRNLVARGFYYTQSLFDVALITTIVHVTGGSLSPFAALYILATACASLLLPVGGGLLIAASGLAFASSIASDWVRMLRPRQLPSPSSAFSNPHNIRMVVVLPEPLGPRKPHTSPSGTAISM